MEEKIMELLSKEDFVTAFVEAKNPEEFEHILNDNGIVLDGISAEKAFSLLQEQKKDELSESELGKVAGGLVLSTTLFAAAGALALGGLGVVTLCSYAVNKYKQITKK